MQTHEFEARGLVALGYTTVQSLCAKIVKIVVLLAEANMRVRRGRECTCCQVCMSGSRKGSRCLNRGT